MAEAGELPLRERKLAELGLALLDRDRQKAQELLRELVRLSPRDPDLERFRELLEADRRRPRRVQPH
jgi:hypothetical protein